MRFFDLTADATRSTMRRLVRNVLTAIALGTGTGAMAAILCLSQSAAAEIVDRLDGLVAATAVVSISGDAWADGDEAFVTPAQDAFGKSVRIGTFTVLNRPDLNVVSSLQTRRVACPIIVATQEGLEARAAVTKDGAYASDALAAQGATFAAVGASLAAELGLDLNLGSRVIYLDSRPITVTALVSDGGDNSLLATALIIPPGVADRLGILPPTRDLSAALSPSIMASATQSLPLVIRPSNPSSVTVSTPPSATQLVAGISADTQASVNVVAIVTGLVSALSVIVTMQIAVRERRGEIGLLRSLGATRSEVGAKFLLEAVLVGSVSSILGWVLGVTAAATVILLNGWSFYFPPEVFVVAGLGFAVGLLAGIPPALSASRVDPITLIRDVN